jgi:hypothetical protein
LDLPLAEAASPHAPWIAAQATPWPGRLALMKQIGASAFALNRLIEARATMGSLTAPRGGGPQFVFDRGNDITVQLTAGALASISEAELLGGANAAAIGDAATGFEIVQFMTAQLIGAGTYRLSTLLRGQAGSGPEMLPNRAAGSRFILLNAAVVQPAMALQDAALAQVWRVGPAQLDAGSSAYREIAHQGKLLGLRPLSPCRPRLDADGGDLLISWIRRTRAGGDAWELAEVPLSEESESYALDIFAGATLKRSVTVATPVYRYLAAAIAADFGAIPSTLSVSISQVSAAFGKGAAFTGVLHA